MKRKKYKRVEIREENVKMKKKYKRVEIREKKARCIRRRRSLVEI